MLPKAHKLKKDNDFKNVFKKGKYSQKEFIKIKFSKNDLEISRFGFMIGLKISKKAVERNRIRRWLQETIRLNLEEIKTGFDLIIMASPEILGKKHQEISDNLINLLKERQLIR